MFTPVAQRSLIPEQLIHNLTRNDIASYHMQARLTTDGHSFQMVVIFLLLAALAVATKLLLNMMAATSS